MNQLNRFNRVRYTIYGNTFGSQIIEEPSGWNQDNLELMRSTKFEGIMTVLNSALEFYGLGYQLLKGERQVNGIKANVRIEREERNENTDEWEINYSANFDFSTYKQKKNYISIKMKESEFFSNIESRFKDNYELERLKDLKNGVLEPLVYQKLLFQGTDIFRPSLFRNDINYFMYRTSSPSVVDSMSFPMPLIYKSDENVFQTAITVSDSGEIDNTTAFTSTLGATIGQFFYITADNENEITIKIKGDFKFQYFGSGSKNITFRFSRFIYDESTGEFSEPIYENLTDIFALTSSLGQVTKSIDFELTFNKRINECFQIQGIWPGDSYPLRIDYNNCSIELEETQLSETTDCNALTYYQVFERLFKIITGKNSFQSTLLSTTWKDLLFTNGFKIRQVPDKNITTSLEEVYNSLSAIDDICLIIQNNTVRVEKKADVALSLIFSINGIDYQTEPIFEDVDTGNYTLYAKDRLGCIKSISITNNGETNGNITTPYVFVSESNSLRFIRRLTWQNCGNYKNIFNTLSCEENQDLKPNRFIQLFQSCDTIGTQIKTSYQNIEVYAKDNLGIETELTANKIVSNIGISDKRDCTYYTFEGKLAVLFTFGNIYDYDSTDIIGTYELNGLLPAYGIVGTWVETPYGTLQIANIRLADNGQRSLILNLNISLEEILNSTIQTIYNKESYDIWEFNTPMNDFLNKTFTIGMRFYQTEVDELFPDVFYISEKINVKVRHPKSLEMIWYNSKNTDIYFFSGIQMKNRLNFADVNTQSFDGSIENQLTDSQVISIDAVNYNGVDFEVNYLTTGMVRKIVLALKHDNLIIENVPYKLTENPEVSRMGKSNFYSIKAKLLEAGDVWNQGTANTQTLFTNVELIGLLSGDSESQYLRII